MSDLLAPILFVIEDELDAFWCFVAYMDRVVRKFKIPYVSGAYLIFCLEPKF